MHHIAIAIVSVFLIVGCSKDGADSGGNLIRITSLGQESFNARPSVRVKIFNDTDINIDFLSCDMQGFSGSTLVDEVFGYGVSSGIPAGASKESRVIWPNPSNVTFGRIKWDCTARQGQSNQRLFGQF